MIQPCHDTKTRSLMPIVKRKLASREAALSTDGLHQRFERNKPFGDDDDHGFQTPYGHY